MTFILAAIIFLLVIAALVSIRSTLRAGRALQREIERVTEGRDRR